MFQDAGPETYQMRKITLIVSLLQVICIQCYCQRFYVSPNVGLQFSVLDYIPSSKTADKDFHVPRPTMKETPGLTFYYRTSSFTHKLGVQKMAMGINFRIQIYDGNNHGYTGNYYHSNFFSHYLISYGLQKESKSMKPFIGNSLSKFKISMGAGIGTNESKLYYKESCSGINYSRIGYNNDCFGYNYSIKRNGLGVFLMPEAGIDVFNKIGKRILNLDVFYYQGIKNMTSYYVHYYYTNTADNINVQNDVVVKTRGTVFGVKVGIPIKLVY